MRISRRPVALTALTAGVAALAVSGCGDATQGGSEPPDHAPTLFLAGDGELWVVDAEAETSQHIRMPELAPGDAPYRAVTRGDRVVLWGYDTYALDARHPERQPEVIAKDSWIFIPSNHADRVWVGFLDPEHEPRTRPLSTLSEIAADGSVTDAGVRPPEGGWPERAFDSGLLFYTQANGWVLWDPKTESVRKQFESEDIQDLGPSQDDLLASCPDGCRELWLTEVLTGSRSAIPAPEGLAFEIWDGAFSPDDGTLAVPVSTVGENGWESPKQLGLVSPETGEVTIVPGSTVPGGYVNAAWTSSGKDVFLTGGERGEPRAVVVYHVGDERARHVDVNVGDFYDAAAW